MAEGVAGEFAEVWQTLFEETGKKFAGNHAVVEAVLTCLFAGGNCLLEGVPGLGKTLLVRTLSQILGLDFSRIQFTPDLMPADITGANVMQETGKGSREMVFRKGPLFAGIILADEVNRATPKTQSALLEAMQEGTVTAGGTTHTLPEQFMVLATQNPIEMEGTYPLPEAQLDRFMLKILVTPPDKELLCDIISKTTGNSGPEPSPVLSSADLGRMKAAVRDVLISPPVIERAADLVLATTPDSKLSTEKVRQYVRYGSSPRGAQALILAAKVIALADGRLSVGVDDIDKAALNALRHRIILNFEGEAEGISPDVIISDILKNLKVE